MLHELHAVSSGGVAVVGGSGGGGEGGSSRGWSCLTSMTVVCVLVVTSGRGLVPASAGHSSAFLKPKMCLVELSEVQEGGGGGGGGGGLRRWRWRWFDSGEAEGAACSRSADVVAGRVGSGQF